MGRQSLSLVTTNHPFSGPATANNLVIENFVVCRSFSHSDCHIVEECLLYSALLTVTADIKACHWTHTEEEVEISQQNLIQFRIQCNTYMYYAHIEVE